MKQAALPLAMALALHPAARGAEPPLAMLVSVEIIGVAPLGGMGVERRLLPYAVQVADSERMAGAHSDNLADYLERHVNGVNVNSISGSPFQNDITYRGYRASPVLGSAQGLSVYLDGVRINEPFGDVVNWDMLPEAALAGIKLVPGANPAFGLNTLGGALALESKSGLSHPGAVADLSFNGDGRRRIDLSIGGVDVHGWHAFAAGTLFDEAGWRDHSAGRLANLYAKAGRRQVQHEWSVALLAGASRLRGNGLLPDAMYVRDRRASYSFPDLTRNRVLQLSAAGKQRLGAGAELSATVYARSSRRDADNGDAEWEDDSVEGVFNTSATRQSGQGASVLLGLRPGEHRLDLGATFDRSSSAYAQFEQDATLTAEREVVPEEGEEAQPGSSVTGTSSAWGVFASDTWKLAPRVHATASARWNHAVVANTLTSDRGVQPHERFTYNSFNPAFGLAYDAGRGLTLAANAARGNRVPTVIELGCADPEQPCRLPVGLQADPYLRQVVARTVELGARWQQGEAQATLALYRTGNRDDILFLSSGVTRLGYFANFARSRHQGVDASAGGRAGMWTWRAGYSYLDAEYDADGVLFTGVRTVSVKPGTPIAGLPRHSAKVSLAWQAGEGVRLGADLQVRSSLPVQGSEDDPAPLRTAGYALLNMHASWTPAPRWEAYARLNNVFDRRHETFGAVARDLFSEAGRAGETTRFVAPGAVRSLAAGLRYRY